MHGSIGIDASIDLKKYPYDTQNISITITSWAHTASEIFVFPSGEVKKDSISIAEYHFQEDIVWEVIGLDVNNATNVWPSGAYSEVTFSILLKR